MSAEAVPGAPRAMATAARSRRSDFVTLTKPRLNLLVVATTAGGYYLGAGPGANAIELAHVTLATALVAGGRADLRRGAVARRAVVAGADDDAAGGGRRAGHAADLRRHLHAAQAADHLLDRRRRGSGRPAADDRLGRSDGHAVARGVGALRDHLPVADAALPRYRLAVQGRLPAGRLPDAAG